MSSACSDKAEPDEVRCTAVVTKIVAIQEERDRLTTEMDEMFAAAEAGEIPKAEAIERSHRWQQRETTLRTKVTGLYDQAYRSKCL